ncbi:MAG: methyl-accepting chemotaxis protein [Agathobacter sp.]|nr:methyl-accepting chemotaxis protein [Agathobacter sp.]
MKQKTRKMNVRTKILVPAIVFIILICVLQGFFAYRSINEGMVQMGVEQAKMAAQIAADGANSIYISEFGPDCETTAQYQTVLTSLRNVQQKYNIEYLYLLYTDGNKVYYMMDTDTSELQAHYGQEFEKSYEQLATAFGGEEIAQEYIDRTEYGNLISVYRPITNSSGEVVAVIGSDFNANNIISKLNECTRNVIVVAIICLIISVALMGITVESICKNLRTVNQKVYDLVHSEGDLTQKLNIHTGDELELIAENINKLLEHIRGIMFNISNNSVQLTDSSKKVVGNLSSAEMNVTDVSATMEEMSAAMEETSASLNQVNSSIISVYDAVESIFQSADEGKSAADEVMTKAADIYEKAVSEQEHARELAQEMANAVNEKIEKSKAVEEITTLTTNIISITEQTNLLSLNASIEAARAGEAGRGFAVVADEIGKLAANSAETAAQIQRVSVEVVDAVNDLAKKAEEMLTFMDETAMAGYEKLLETSGSYRSDVGDMNQMMERFANESEQIRDSIDQIKEAVSAVSIAVEESAQGVTNVTEMSVDLTTSMGDIGNEASSNMDIANQLNAEVGKFKLE